MRTAVFILLAAASATLDGVDLLARGASSVELGQSTHLSLTVVPRGGERLLDGGPFDVRVDAVGLEVAQPTYHRNDAVDAKADAPRFEIEVKGSAPGPGSVTAHVRMYLCAAQQCRPVETQTSWSIEVKAKAEG